MVTPTAAPNPLPNPFDSPRAAVDASPLIVLAKVGRLDLLTRSALPESLSPTGARELQLTETVYREVLAGDPNDPARLALIGGFGVRTPDVPIPAALSAWTAQKPLDAGEKATLALALSEGMPCVLDDGDARQAARALGVACVGTFGLVLVGKRRGWVASAADTLRALRAVNYFLPPESVLRAELALLGETWP